MIEGAMPLRYFVALLLLSVAMAEYRICAAGRSRNAAGTRTTMTKVVAIVFALITAGVAYATWYGIAAESQTVTRSVRAGSIGNGTGFGVK
ncbi:MAG: hypothetical protein R3C97_13375 [Geminicoccaceae bacterium]